MGEWMYRSTYSWPRHQLEVRGQLHGPSALSPRKELSVPIDWNAGWAPEPVWTTWRGEIIFPLLRIESKPLSRPACSRSVYGLPYPGFYSIHINHILIFLVCNSGREISCLGRPTSSVSTLCFRTLVQYSRPTFWYVILYPFRTLGKKNDWESNYE
jgi:hypothetical protein